jgi:Zn finger protein HypA/HybF involved in hydrogenase expression
MSIKVTTQSFIAKARNIHGDTYDYSKVTYVSAKQRVTFICRQHGEFIQQPTSHLVGVGCPKCGRARSAQATRLTLEEFLHKAKLRHGDRFDYAQVEYRNFDTKVTILCPEHGAFQQTPAKHLASKGCTKCGRKHGAASKRIRSATEFLAKAKAVHGDRYDYTPTKYVGVFEAVTINCPDHGPFQQTPDNHIHDHGCPQCGIDTAAFTRRRTPQEFEAEAREVHGDLYQYDQEHYSAQAVEITCKKHGPFQQHPQVHLTGCGCPKCGLTQSKGERELFDYIKSIHPEAISGDRKLLQGTELDVVIPSIKLAFEYNGLYHHSEARPHRSGGHRHYEKSQMAEAVGYRLIHIYEDDWQLNRKVVEHTLNHILGRAARSYARQYVVRELPSAATTDFYLQHHMQGPPNGGRTFCLTSKDGTIQAAMTICLATSERRASTPGRFEIIRFATSHAIAGAASRLLKHFLRSTPEVTEVISYSDSDMFTGAMYQKLGFSFAHNVPPDYKVLINKRRVHKSSVRRSELQKRFPETFDPLLTERENCLKHGLYRIYGSGLKKWVLKVTY